MDSGKGRADEKYMFLGKDWDSEKMLDLYIYDYMIKRGFNDVAEKFAKEANLKMLELMNSEVGMLMEWWKLLWPQICSRVTNKAGENPHSPAQPTMQNLPAMLASLKNPEADRSQEPPTGNTNTSSILGLSAGQAFENEPARYFPVQLLPTQNSPVRPAGNLSHLQMPLTLSPLPQAAKAPRSDVSGERSVQVESACPAGQGSTYPPAAPNAGLSDS